MTPLRWLAEISAADGSWQIILPTARYEYQSDQPLVNSYVQLAGVNYQYDQLRGAPSIKQNGSERVRFLAVGIAEDIGPSVDALKAVQNSGRIKIWTHGAEGKRWAWARYPNMPQISFTVENASVTEPVFLSFDRLSDWYDEHAIGAAGIHNSLSNPQTIVVTNDGNAPIRNAIIIVKGTFNGLTITNNSSFLPGSTTPYVLASSRVGTLSSHWLKFDCGENTVSFSDDSGATWTDDWSHFVRQTGQIGLMTFVPGDNSVVVAAASGAGIVFDYYGAWH